VLLEGLELVLVLIVGLMMLLALVLMLVMLVAGVIVVAAVVAGVVVPVVLMVMPVLVVAMAAIAVVVMVVVVVLVKLDDVLVGLLCAIMPALVLVSAAIVSSFAMTGLAVLMNVVLAMWVNMFAVVIPFRVVVTEEVEPAFVAESALVGDGRLESLGATALPFCKPSTSAWEPRPSSSVPRCCPPPSPSTRRPSRTMLTSSSKPMNMASAHGVKQQPEIPRFDGSSCFFRHGRAVATSGWSSWPDGKAPLLNAKTGSFRTSLFCGLVRPSSISVLGFRQASLKQGKALPLRSRGQKPSNVSHHEMAGDCWS